MYTPLEELEFSEPPDYKWEVEVFDAITIATNKRPSLWSRFWFCVLFGWQWKKIDK
jgi:hypothetical protein